MGGVQREVGVLLIAASVALVHVLDPSPPPAVSSAASSSEAREIFEDMYTPEELQRGQICCVSGLFS